MDAAENDQAAPINADTRHVSDRATLGTETARRRARAVNRNYGLQWLDRHLTPLDHPVTMLQRERTFSEQAVVKFHSLLSVEGYGD